MIKLRYLEVEDAEEFFRILNEGKFDFYYATIPESVEAEREWINRREYKRDNNIEYSYAIIYEGILVGGCEIRIDQQNLHIGELGYFIDREFFNKGIVTEVVKRLEKIAFDELRLVRLEIRMDPQNCASERVAQKNHFVKEGMLKKAIEFNGEYYDNWLYVKVR